MTTKKILILAANPKGSSRLRLDEEVREIDEGLGRARHRDRFELEQRWAVRPRDIQRALLDVNPQIVHFSGHGDQEAGLIFEDELGHPKFVDGNALAGLFALFTDLECVVLNGCYSETQAQAIADYVPYVVGMNQAIGDRAAIIFAVSFYDALGAGRSIEFAYKLGCSAIRLEGIAEGQTPTLIKQDHLEQVDQAQVDQKVDQRVDHQNSSEVTPQFNQQVTPQVKDQTIKIFVSYSHKDEELRKTLDMHLAALRRQGKIQDWNDRAIEAGEEWDMAIKANLESAQIILLLISPSFIASEYCYDKEMQRAMERHEEGTARVIPIILKPSDWKDTPFSKLQALPKEGKPITRWRDRDEAFLNVVQGIRRVVESFET